MADLFENPLGLDGFEVLEFCSPQKRRHDGINRVPAGSEAAR